MSLSDLNDDSIALDGIDPVAYFNGETLQGSPEYTFELRGVSYRFANVKNLEAFQKDPAQYIPDFAGSYLRNPDHSPGTNDRGDVDRIAEPNARLESRGMGQDTIDPLPGDMDPAMKINPGYETDDEVEMSNLSDSNS